jgi:hypothetical protein
MVTNCRRIESLDELRRYVSEILCSHYQLKIGAFHMTERVLVRGKKPCGMFFCLHGPRQVKFTAIWETDRNRILFYGCAGERIQKIQLMEAPALESAAA